MVQICSSVKQVLQLFLNKNSLEDREKQRYLV